MSHFDAIIAAPPGFRSTASTADAPVAALEDRDRGIYGVQFHPEVAHTDGGQEMLKALPLRRVRLPADVDETSIIEASVAAIRAQVGAERVICGLSGRRRLGGGRRARAQGGRATSSPACSSTPACCGRARPSRSRRRSGDSSTSTSST